MRLHLPAVTAALFLGTCFTSIAQRTSEDFNITLPEQKVAHSRYNSFRLVDGRADSSDMGIVQLGAFNRKAFVRPVTPIAAQMQHVFRELIDTSAANGELVLLLRSLSFAEVTKAMSEKGYCYFRADLFAQSPAGYRAIDRIDTVILVSSMDVTRAMFRRGSKTIGDFLAQNLVKEPTDQQDYSLADIIAYDSVQKRKLPVYNTATYREGVYRSFEAFVQQQPEVTNATVALGKNGIPEKVSIPDSAAGKPVKVKSKDLYALVYEGKPYIATDYGYYPLEKKNDDFLFTGKAKVNAASGDVMMASFFFGIIGGLLASSPHDAVFDMKIDHLSGGFVRLKQVPQSTN
ncbi:hypothetical protein [Paraflavitalea sp. CAU 1676]|uniref:hypothetical protein n=1 Tax=Paraflavitalea sp. CAU 1676 TaxID=3032598 RepID=UPI0023DAE0BC|nr:hypothetical protein [Paraflavitalea sp. CAU 1676]MDF2190422.1 hypothetical protein [Paraflavitalea sp. CAU 1676]